MKYSLDFIYHNRFDKDRSHVRILSERFIPLNFIYKIFSPFPTYLFLNLGIHPDWITIASLILVLIGSCFIIFGYALTGAIIYLLFLLLDSVDGDMARCIGPTPYGGIIDSFGADLFYACAPISFGYFLFSKGIIIGYFKPHHLLLVSALASILFLGYRLVKVKKEKFSNTQPVGKSYVHIINSKKNQNILFKYIARPISFFRHILFKNNFFAEPGMVFWFFILTLFSAYNILGIYLILIFIYNLIYLIIDFTSAVIYFRNVN